MYLNTVGLYHQVRLLVEGLRRCAELGDSFLMVAA